jgi:hypothetical protein
MLLYPMFHLSTTARNFFRIQVPVQAQAQAQVRSPPRTGVPQKLQEGPNAALQRVIHSFLMKY